MQYTSEKNLSLTWIPQERPPNGHRIRLALFQDVDRLLALRDHPHGTHHDARDPRLRQALLHRLRVEHLVPRPCVDLLPTVQPTARDLHPVHAGLREDLGQRHRLRDLPLRDLLGCAEVFEPVGRRDANHQRHGRRDECLGDVDELEQEARSVLEAAAVGVCARVGGWREEPVEQVAVRGVDLDRLPWRISNCEAEGDRGHRKRGSLPHRLRLRDKNRPHSHQH
jgi:hypothetical protein